MSQKTLKIAADLDLPIDLVTEKVAFLGRTGSGKTYGAMKLAELMLGAGAQIGAIDPVGVWRALRVPAEKGGTAFEVVVLGGLYGDLPLRPTAGDLVADLVVDRGLSFVLDVSQFIPSEQQQFIHDFGARLFHRKKSAPSPIHLFLEECQEYIPENPSGREAMTLGVMQRLWKLGRNFGIGGSLISQRPQEIAKKALNMSGTLFAFQMTGPQERKALRAWVADQGVAVDIEQILQKLDVGQPHVESPTVLNVSRTVRILPRVTADLSSTPKLGSSPAAKRLTPIDVEQLTAAMADVVERAKADDPKELRKKIAELEREVRTAKTAAPPAPTKTVEILTDADRQQIAKLLALVAEIDLRLTRFATAQADALAAKVSVLLETARVATADNVAASSSALHAIAERAGFREVVDKMVRVAAAAPPRVILPNRPEIARAEKKSSKIARSSVSLNSPGPGDPSIGRSGLRRMLIALAQRPQGLTRQQLGVRAGLSSRSGTFDTYLSRARQAGWVDGTGELRLTAAGLAALGAFDPLPEGAELLAYWLGELGQSGAARILRTLTDAYPKALTRAELGEAAQLSDRSGTFDTYLSRLRTLELIEGRGEIRASEELFS